METETVPGGDRPPYLVAAGQTLSGWVHDRQAGWGGGPPEAAVPPSILAFPTPVVENARSSPAVLVEPAVTPEPAVAPEAPVLTEPVVVAAPAKVATAPAMPDSPVGAVPKKTRSLKPLVQPLIKSARWIGMAAAAVALVTGAVWIGQSYWQKWTAPPLPGTVTLESLPAGSEVLIDGVIVGITPMRTEARPGHHVVEFRRRGATRTVPIEVASGQTAVGRVDWNAKRTGRLQVHSDPAGAQVTIDGRVRGTTPLTVEDLVAGSHAVLLESASGSVRRNTTIEADRTTEISESIYSGWMHLSAPFEVQLSEGGRPIVLDDRSQALMSPGRHEIHVENRELAYRSVLQVDVESGKTVSVSVVPAPSSLTVTANAAADVLVDGQRVGETPLTSYPVKLGTRDIVVRSASGVVRRFTTTVTSAPIRLDVDFSKQ